MFSRLSVVPATRVFALCAALVTGISCRAQDVHVPSTCSSQSTCTLTPAGGIPWGSGNLVWVFKPIDPRATVYIYFHNLNPTSAHTSQTVNVFQTPFGSDRTPTFSKNTSSWAQAAITQASTPGASCNSVNANSDTTPGQSGLGTCFVTTTMAAQIAIQITGANTQTGSPDNFELSIIQNVAPLSGQNPGNGINYVTPLLVTTNPFTITSGGTSPSAGTQAFATATARPGFRHVLNCIGFGATATTAPSLSGTAVQVTDSVSSVVMFSMGVVVPASTGNLAGPFMVCGINVAGSVNSNLTATWTSGITNVFESITLSWYDVPQ